MKFAILITGLMRTYKKCYKNLLDMIIKPNQQHDIHIFIYTENLNNNENLNNEIKNTYGNYLKHLEIEENILIPSNLLLNGKAHNPYKVLYRNRLLFDIVSDKYGKFDYYLRMRPDVVFNKKICIDEISSNKNTLFILEAPTLNNCYFFRNRDWDYACFGDYSVINLWCDYYTFYSRKEHLR